MYCVRCGVELADTEQRCPLCGTRAFHPDILREEEETLYPKKDAPVSQNSARWGQVLLTAVYVLPMFIVYLCDVQFHNAITWSGPVMGAMLALYVIFLFPRWFHKPNPVIFVPCAFAAVGCFLLYLNFYMDGDWFLSFAFPTTGGICVIVTAVVALLRYVPRGALFIFGGAFISLGAFMLLVEFLINFTFGVGKTVGWSLYPLSVLGLLGGLLIFLGICRPAREMMERKFFI